MTDKTPDLPVTPPEAGSVTFQTRFQNVITVLGDELARYERDTPFWEAQALLDLTKAAVENFWYYLTHPSDLGPPPGWEHAGPVGRRDTAFERPSWDEPEVELQYGVEWDWDKGRAVSGTFTAEELGDDPEKWTEATATLFLNHRTLYVLGLATRNTLVRTDGNTYEVSLPPDLLTKFPSLNALAVLTQIWAWGLEPDAPFRQVILLGEGWPEMVRALADAAHLDQKTRAMVTFAREPGEAVEALRYYVTPR